MRLVPGRADLGLWRAVLAGAVPRLDAAACRPAVEAPPDETTAAERAA